MAHIGDYEIVEAVGKGLHGEVWVAVPPARLGLGVDRVALKVHERPVTATEYERVVAELTVAASTASPHLGKVHDAARWGDRLVVAMEYLPLGSLAGASLDRAELVRAVADAARGAHALHEVGIAHREIKPSNVLRTAAGAKLCDIGLGHVLSPGQTVTGAGIGAMEFMEPGLIRGDGAARASDIWALGAMLHQLLSGRSVFGNLPTGNQLAVLRHVMIATPTIVEELPDAWKAVLGRCLAMDRADRYPTALALAEALETTDELLASR